MPYDADRRLLFIHIPKTAGKSIELALGLADSTRRERWRSNPNLFFTWGQRLTADRSASKRLWGVIDCPVTAQHVTYAEIYLLGLLDGASLAVATKFAVSRNPFDRAVSSFLHWGPTSDRSSQAFEAFLSSWFDDPSRNHNERAHKRAQWEYCVDLSGNLVLDAVLRYESLDDDLRLFARDHLGIAVDVPWIGRQRETRDYRDFYSDRSRRLVEVAFARDIEMFGYTF